MAGKALSLVGAPGRKGYVDYAIDNIIITADVYSDLKPDCIPRRYGAFLFTCLAHVWKRSETSGKAEHAFDGGGNIMSITDANGLVTNFTYANGQLTQITNNSGSLAIAYDQAGRVGSVTDGTAKTVSYNYDGAGNLATVWFKSNVGTTPPQPTSGCFSLYALNGRNESALRVKARSPHAPTARTARPRGD